MFEQFKKLFTPLVLLFLGVFMLVGWLRPYAELPTVTNLKTFKGYIQPVTVNDEIRLNIESTLFQHILCEKGWIDKNAIIMFVNNGKIEEATFEADPTRMFLNDKSRCLPIYSLNINNKSIFTYEDAIKAKARTKRIFFALSIIFILIGTIGLVRMRKYIVTRQV